MSRPATLRLPEPPHITEDPFWAMQAIAGVPLAVLLVAGLDAARFAIAGPSPLERSIEIDVFYSAGFSGLTSWASSVMVAILLYLSTAHATTTAKRWV